MFSCEFCEIWKNLFLQNTTGRLPLIIAVSIVVKGELANETVHYDKKAEAYVMKQSPRGVPRNSVLRNFTKFTGRYLGLPATLLKKRLWHRCFPVNFVKCSKNTFSYRMPLVASSVCTSLSQKRKLSKKGGSESFVHKFSSK